MVDTVKVKFPGRLLFPLAARRQVKLPNGVRFWHDGEGNCKADVELPKLIWGHNGHLLADQAELDQSVALFHASLAEVVKFTSWQWVLVDLCWQFRARAADVIRAHQWTSLAGIRNLPSLIFGGKEISWRGAKSRRALKMYDKNLQARGEAGGVLRVELRLAGPKLREKINVDAGLKFGELYQIFRTEVVKLAPVTLPEPRKHSFADLAAGLPMEIRSDCQLLEGFVVLADDLFYLKQFPTERAQFCNNFAQTFVEIQAIDHGVDFQANTRRLDSICQCPIKLGVRPKAFAASSNRIVGFSHAAVHAQSTNIQRSSQLANCLFIQQRAVGDK